MSFPALKLNLILSYIVFAIFFLHCGGKLSEDESVNNVRKTGQLIEPGQAFTGTYYSDSGIDIDYVYITTDSPKMIRGNLSGVKGIDGEVLFYNEGQRKPFKIANDNSSSLGEKFGPFRIDSPGVVMAIRSSKPVNDASYKDRPYEFTVLLEPAPTSIEIEPNDSLNEAMEITGSYVRGYYNSVFTSLRKIEEDYYVLVLNEKKRYRLSANLSGVQGIDPVLRLYSQDKEKLLKVDNGETGHGEEILSYGVLGPAKIYVSVSAKNNGVSDAEYYELDVEVSEYDEKYEFEPNDIIDHATKLVAEKIFGGFASPTDIDYYWFYNKTTEAVAFSVEVVPAGSIDLNLELFIGKSSQPITYNDGGEEVPEGISSWKLAPGETAYVRVAAEKVKPGVTLEYTLSWEATSLAQGFELEPNNEKLQANPIKPGYSWKGYINPVTETDYYVIRIPKQGNYHIKVDGPPGCAISLSVTDKKGFKTDGALSEQNELTMDAILEPGGFFIVSCEGGKSDPDLEPVYRSPYTIYFERKQ
ncbi:MAG: hypothetical protein ABUK01_10565 [Leptospirales bacterium]